jgi:hypothetical protein
MPAASAEKRAHQCAKRTSQTKSTIVTAQTPHIVSLPTQPSDSVPVLLSSASPASTSIDFETFIDLADLDDVIRFCDTVVSTYEGRNLKLLWDRAFEASLDQGRNEERDFWDEMYLQGKAQNIKEAEEAASNSEINFYRHGIEKGQMEERSEWTTLGHGLQCFSPIAILSDGSTQTDSEPSITATRDASIQVDLQVSAPTISRLDASIQTPEPPPPLNPPQKMSAVPLDWAEDAKSLPITPTIPPSLLQPHDLSVLCSSSSSPFSSLQHHSKRFTHYSHQFRRYHSHFNFNSFNSSHHNSFIPSRLPFRTKTYSHLNWESDPHLSDLSRSLKALGWIRAH